MGEPIRYSHTNLIARDWKRLAAFYQHVFHCKLKPPERDLSGDWLDAATGIRGAHIRGIHMTLPGYGEDGPTLEIFAYEEVPSNRQKRHDGPGLAWPGPSWPGQSWPGLARPGLSWPGLAHLAFAVDDVEKTLERLLEAGGSKIGEIVMADIPQAGRIEFVYARDPEGNIVEIQKWERTAKRDRFDEI